MQRKHNENRKPAQRKMPQFIFMRRRRAYFYRRQLRDYRKRSRRRLHYGLCLTGIALLTVLVIYSAIRLGLYLRQGNRSAQVSNELREVYHSEPTATPTAPLTDATISAAAQETGQIAVKLLPALQYAPSDSSLRTRFQKLQRRNEDIVGWLTIDGLLDEAVVQRDNAYYLRRDYLGYHNVNGAIFLDEGCNLKERPYTYILYGHNMKSQAMFGCLRHYDDTSFYHDSPFFTFDTYNESGRYVIFSVAIISLDRNDSNFVDLNKLDSTTVMWREEIIGDLQARSRYSQVIDVAADDQILLLVTCKGEDDDARRIIAARRIREDETEDRLLREIQSSYRQR